MTGPEHYKLAEEILDQAKRFMAETLRETTDAADIGEVFANHAQMVAQAQVHATLALAAATAQNIRRNGPVGIATTGWEDALQDGGQS